MCADRRSASGYGQAIAMTASLQGLPSLHPAMLHLLRAGVGQNLPNVACQRQLLDIQKRSYATRSLA
jgi:hypothetical protein